MQRPHVAQSASRRRRVVVGGEPWLLLPIVVVVLSVFFGRLSAIWDAPAPPQAPVLAMDAFEPGRVAPIGRGEPAAPPSGNEGRSGGSDSEGESDSGEGEWDLEDVVVSHASLGFAESSGVRLRFSAEDDEPPLGVKTRVPRPGERT